MWRWFRATFERRYEDKNPFHRKCCAVMSLRGGCAVVCAIWLGLNTYIATVAFLGYTPIFSYLNQTARYIFASMSIVFALVSILILFGLFVDTPRPLQAGAYILVILVPLYLIDTFANIIVFGVQKAQYLEWCIHSSQGLSQEIQLSNNHTIDASSIATVNTYNCSKLWEDELKFSIAFFIVISICYLYWALCVFYYYEKLRELFPEYVMQGPWMNYINASARFLPQTIYRNEPPMKV